MRSLFVLAVAVGVLPLAGCAKKQDQPANQTASNDQASDMNAAPAGDPMMEGGDPMMPGGGHGDPMMPGGGHGDPMMPGGGHGDPMMPGGGHGDPMMPGGGHGDPMMPGGTEVADAGHGDPTTQLEDMYQAAGADNPSGSQNRQYFNKENPMPGNPGKGPMPGGHGDGPMPGNPGEGPMPGGHGDGPMPGNPGEGPMPGNPYGGPMPMNVGDAPMGGGEFDGGGQQNVRKPTDIPGVKEGTPEYVAVDLILKVAQGQTDGLETLISDEATGLLEKLRKGPSAQDMKEAKD